MTFYLRKVTKLKNKGNILNPKPSIGCLIMNNFWLRKKLKKGCLFRQKGKKVGASKSMGTMSLKIKSISPKWILFSTKWIPILPYTRTSKSK